MPTAASTRPQLGSWPCSAHLSRLLRPTARAASSASSTAGRADDLDGDVLAGALGVADHLLREVVADGADGRLQLGRASASRRWRRWRAAARCRWCSCSRRCRPGRRCGRWPRAAPRRAAAASATASVATTASMVASAGDSIAAPLAMPPTDQPSPGATAVLATVSVVRIASRGGGAAVRAELRRRPRRRRAAAGPSAGARRSGRSSRRRRGRRRCRARRRRPRRCGGCRRSRPGRCRRWRRRS